jgi:hypothetical protein
LLNGNALSRAVRKPVAGAPLSQRAGVKPEGRSDGIIAVAFSPRAFDSKRTQRIPQTRIPKTESPKNKSQKSAQN